MIVTVRERIMEQLRRVIEGIKDDEGSQYFERVLRTPLDRDDKNLDVAASVLDMNEDYNYEVGYVFCSLRVGIEWVMKVREGEVNSTLLNRALGELKRAVMAKPNLPETDDAGVPTGDDLTINILLAEDEINHEPDSVKRVDGYLQIDVQYRHGKQDPSRLM